MLASFVYFLATHDFYDSVEPLAYLFVWHLLGANRDVVPSKAEHLKKRPSSEQIAAWVAANGALFEANFPTILDLYGLRLQKHIAPKSTNHSPKYIEKIDPSCCKLFLVKTKYRKSMTKICFCITNLRKCEVEPK